MDSYQWLPWVNFIVLAVNLYLVWRYTTYTKGIMDHNREQADLSLRPIVYLKDLVYRPSKVPISVLGFELRNIGETAAKYKVTVKTISFREEAGNDITPVLPSEIGNEHVILPYKGGMGAPHIFELGITEKNIAKGSDIHANVIIEYWRADSVAQRRTYTYSSTVDVFGFKAKPGSQETQQRLIVVS